MSRVTSGLHLVAFAGVLAGVSFLIAPVDMQVDPIPHPSATPFAAPSLSARQAADSLSEDIILYNIFSPSRSAPARRFAGYSSGSNAAPDPASVVPAFVPVLSGIIHSGTPGEARALLQMSDGDPGPRLYAIGDASGGYRVASIDATSVVLSGPRGRVVLRLPDREENHS